MWHGRKTPSAGPPFFGGKVSSASAKLVSMAKELPFPTLPRLSARDIVRGDEVASAVNEIAQRGGRFLVTRYNKPVAALVPVADLEVLARLDGWSWSDLETLKHTARGDEPASERSEDNVRT